LLTFYVDEWGTRNEGGMKKYKMAASCGALFLDKEKGKE